MTSRPSDVAPAGQPVDPGLGEVAEGGEAAHHVAVERAVADRDLALVPGGEHQQAELVGERHQERAPRPRLEVLLGDVRLTARELLGQDLVEGRGDRGDRQLEQADRQRLGELLRAREALRRGGRTASRRP